MDTGATAHIITDKSKFLTFVETFKSSDHYLELADGSRTNGLVQGKGNARVMLEDVRGQQQHIILEKALYVPSFNQDIFSVQGATGKGATVHFSKDSNLLMMPDGTIFDIQSKGKLYFYNKIATSKCSAHSVHEWHKILGHCNLKDVVKLEKCVNGMKIIGKEPTTLCDTCVKGKMSEWRNREADKRATTQLELVHCDLARPVDPAARDDFRYVLSFVDDFSGVITLYLLKQKSDTSAATEKFLADISPF